MRRFIRPAAYRIRNLRRSIDMHQPIADHSIRIRILHNVRRAASYIAIFDNGFIWNSERG